MPNQRGLPLVGRGMTGAIPGTDPLQALLAKERREENKARRRSDVALGIANHRLRMRQLANSSKKASE